MPPIDAATDRGWDKLFDQLGDRQVMRLVAKAGGRAAFRAKGSGVKDLRPRLPKKTGALRKGLRGTIKRVRERGTGLWVWKVVYRSTVPYWGKQIQRPRVRDAYTGAQRVAADWWRTRADDVLADVLREEVKR